MRIHATGVNITTIEPAAPTAIDAVYTSLGEATELEEVLFCCLPDADLEIYQNAHASVAA